MSERISKQILIADDFHPVLLDVFTKEKVDFIYKPDIQRDEIIKYLQNGISGLVIRSKTNVDAGLLSTAVNLSFVARGGAGMDNIDEDFARQKGIRLFNSENANSDSVAEQSIGMLLSLLHKISSADKQVKNNIWLREPNRGIELMGKTVGIFGYGNTGSALARKLSGFNVKVLAYDKYKSGFSQNHIIESTPQQIFEEADIVSIHLPLDSHTRFMIDSQFLQSFVKNIILLNLSRGEIVKTTDVISALKNGKLCGFAADVLEDEKLRAAGDSGPDWFQELIQFDNVILTPHVGGWSVESYKRIAAVIAEKVTGFLGANT